MQKHDFGSQKKNATFVKWDPKKERTRSVSHVTCMLFGGKSRPLIESFLATDKLNIKTKLSALSYESMMNNLAK